LGLSFEDSSDGEVIAARRKSTRLLLQCPMSCIIVSRAAKNSQLCQQTKICQNIAPVGRV